MGTKTVFCVLAAWGFVALTVTSAHPQELRLPPDFSLSLGEPVAVVLTIQNQSDESVNVDLGQDRTRGISLSGKKPNGEKFALSLPPKDGLSFGGSVTIPPHDEYKQQLLLNDWMAFDQTGVYQIALAILDRPQPLTKLIKVNITPRNDEALRAASARLAEVILGSNTAQDELDAEHALAAIVDPIAVPFLQLILDRSDIADAALLPALGRIRTPGARAILEQAASSDNQERAAIARDVLTRPEAYKITR